jgi:hypothetical protein
VLDLFDARMPFATDPWTASKIAIGEVMAAREF